MLVENLIEQLQKFPKGTQVCIMDWRKNLGDDIGEGSSTGIYSDFEVQMQTFTDDEKEYYKECHGREFIPFIQLSFENENYTDEGKYLLEEDYDINDLGIGIGKIINERRKQINKHGFTGKHHAEHPEWYDLDQLIDAACTILLADDKIRIANVPKNWNPNWWADLCNRPYNERLIIYGALIAAEIDRLEELDK